MALSGLKTKNHNKVTLKSDKPTGSDESSSESDSNDQIAEGNVGWANSIAKVLNTTKPKTKKTLVLSRAKKIKLSDKVNSAEDYGFEIEGEIKEEKPSKEELDEKVKQRKNKQLDLRIKPSWKDIDRERSLRKIATRGVVQLFNAVRIQQKDLQTQLDEAGPLDSRKEAVLNNINKRKFLDVLMSGNRAKSEAVDNPVKNEFIKEDDSSDDDNDDTTGSSKTKNKSEWNVLRDDFMTNKKIKHWDEEDSDNNSQPEDDDSETDD